MRSISSVSRSARSDAFDLVLDLGAAPLLDWHAPPQGYFHLPASADRDRQGCGRCCELRDLVGEFEKPQVLRLPRRSSAPTAATSRSAATPASTSVRRMRSSTGDKERRSQSWSTRTCASAAAPAPPSARPARWATPIRARPTRGAEAAHAARDLRQGRRARCRCCCCTARRPGRPLVELGRAGAARRASTACRPRVIPFAALAHGQHRHRHLAQRDCLGREPGAGAGHRRGGAAVPGRARRQQDGSIAQALLLRSWATPARTSALLERHARHRARRAGCSEAAADRSGPARLDRALQAVPAEAGSAALRRRRRQARDARTGARPPDPAGTGRCPPAGRARPTPALAIALPARARPFGAIAVDKERCTLCLACVGACPASALQDNPSAPQLRFIEKNCVQCGLCETHLPRGCDHRSCRGCC